jgi:hypothetical protein
VTRKQARRKRARKVAGGAVITTGLVALCGLLLLSFVLRQITPRRSGRPGAEAIRVEVLNGAGEDGMAQRVAGQLRGMGFDVVEIGNAQRSDFAETVVVERLSADSRHARILARAIGCRRVVQDIDSLRYLEATLILGSDFRKFFDSPSER